ncbi:ATP-dependent 6-phosphofructokinase [Fervidobacterium sp. 2310opik-2]|uniref:6-phosphofructokinase n=1 Tax=Fervidobacterium sp. 2310opik-2 TaxID=1755815 RepID=UPI0013E020D4|nr:ATP-dependent 6-phosphofructokinase [Fervidobacterium sp. 2310opik-2]KAF2961108.1 6-phosphofructokinase [Fervidobacterium sp. 2310opik-2]
MRRIGILSVGNDCPGLNAAIRSVVVNAIEKEIEVMGIKDGFEGLLKDKVDILVRDDVSGILHRGGTILGTSLFIPEKDEDLVTIKNKTTQYGISGYIIFGGRNAVKSALNLQKYGIPSIIVPATIDNDLSFTDFSIGFITALEHVTQALDIIHSTAESHHRVMIVKTMGAPGGWLATFGGLAGGADFVVTSSDAVDPKELVTTIQHRYESGKRFSIVVVEDGVKLPDEILDECKCSYETDPAEVIGLYIERKLNIEWRYTNLGYIQRGGVPAAIDRIIATQMSARAVELVKMGKFYHAVGVKGFIVTEVPYSETLLNVRPVDYYIKQLAKIFY